MTKRVKAGTSTVETVGEKLTPRQEKFATLTATGMGQSEAYRAAYNAKRMKASSVHELASRLAAHVKVKSRVAEIRKPIVEQARYSLKEAMAEAEEARVQALMLGQTGPAVSAVTLRSRLNGLLVEDRPNARDAYTDMSDSELESVIAEADRVIKSAQSPGSAGVRKGRTGAKVSTT